jgi:hypothetical protein
MARLIRWTPAGEIFTSKLGYVGFTVAQFPVKMVCVGFDDGVNISATLNRYRAIIGLDFYQPIVQEPRITPFAAASHVDRIIGHPPASAAFTLDSSRFCGLSHCFPFTEKSTSLMNVKIRKMVFF